MILVRVLIVFNSPHPSSSFLSQPLYSTVVNYRWSFFLMSFF